MSSTDSEQGRSDTDRMVVTLAGKSARLARRLAAEQEVLAPETLRRGLSLLEVYIDLKPKQHLAIVDETTGETERVRPLWL